MSSDKFAYDFFISAGSSDATLVKTIRHSLRNYRVFSSEDNLKFKTGETFFDVISEAINDSQHFILLVSPESLSSKWVQIEYQTFFNNCYAKDEERKIFLLKGKGFTKDLVPLLFRNFQFADNIDQIKIAVSQPGIDSKTENSKSATKSPENISTIKKKNPVLLILMSLLLVMAVLIISKLAPRDRTQKEAQKEIQNIDKAQVPSAEQVQLQKGNAKGESGFKIVTLNNGDRYEGDMKMGKMHGNGTLYFSQRRLISKFDMQNNFAESGDYIKGKWYEGELDYGTLFSAKGDEKRKIFIGH